MITLPYHLTFLDWCFSTVYVTMAVKFVLLVNKQGQTRVAQYYEYKVGDHSSIIVVLDDFGAFWDSFSCSIAYLELIANTEYASC